jgi:hypothetical protein
MSTQKQVKYIATTLLFNTSSPFPFKSSFCEGCKFIKLSPEGTPRNKKGINEKNIHETDMETINPGPKE